MSHLGPILFKNQSIQIVKTKEKRALVAKANARL